MKTLDKILIGLGIFAIVSSAVVGGLFFFADLGLIGPHIEQKEPEIGGNAHERNIYQINNRGYGHTLNTLGDANILVIPVSFTDYEYKSTEENRKKIETTFFGTQEETKWESLNSFYLKSSGNKLNIQGTVTDWFDTGMTTNELLSHKTKNPNYKNSGEDGTWYILNEAIKWYETTAGANPKAFDKDNDGFYDLVWLVYNAPFFNDNNKLPSAFWAFTFWEMENAQKNPSFGKKLPNCYCWASLDFADVGYGPNGHDAHTFIHETGHGLGLNDYYFTSGNACYPFGCIDMMDFNIGDHCSYSKYLMGWLTPKEVINKPGTYTLKSTAETGDFLILTDNYNGSPFDEYFVVEFMTPTGLNHKDYTNKYKGNNLIGYKKPGIRISHVDARGIGFTRDDKVYLTNDFGKIAAKTITNSTDGLSPYGKLYKSPQTGIYFKENTIMQKDVGMEAYSVLGPNFSPLESDPLFYKGEEFSLERNSKYRKLMPSKSNILNNGLSFNYRIHVDNIDMENGATITVSKY